VASRRRNTELGLLVMVVVIIGAAYVLTSLGSVQKIPLNIGPFLLMVLGLMLFAHLMVRRLAPDADPILLPVAAMLNGLGYVLITGLNERLAALQATWTAVGVGAFVAVLLVVPRTRAIERYRYTFALLGIGLLLLPLVPHVGREIHGSRIWVSVGPIGFQPGELAKIALAIFFASYLVEKRELLAMRSFRLGPLSLPDPKHLGPVLLAWAASIMIMVAQKDLGSSLLFFTLFIVMLWVATSRPSYLAAGAVMFGVASYASWKAFGHVRSRVSTWIDPWKDPLGDSFQIVKGWFAMANGGLTGTGLGLGNQEHLIFIESDFIFVAVAQELGLFGATLVLSAYLLLVGSGLRVAARSDHAFDKLLAVGLTTLIGVQAFIIVGGIVRVLPLTGVTLPFIAYGGSSLVSSWIMLALLLRLSDENHRRAAEKEAMVAVA
jgi:cell division protein FtsW (lipid II flippase)